MANKKKSKSAGIWRPGEGGYEITGSPEIITNALVRLKEKRGAVALFHKGYQCGSTILGEIDRTSLYIDKPVDWPGTSMMIRVVFKDDANVWNKCTVKVLDTCKDTLKTEIPTELFRLQRRGNFRIDVPHGSQVSFRRREDVFTDIPVANISARGLLVSLNTKDSVVGESLDDSIHDVCIQLFSEAEAHENQNSPITVCKARIVREVFNRRTGRFMLGVELFPKIKEEKELLKYVRARELEILRKGIK